MSIIQGVKYGVHLRCSLETM